MEQKDVSPVPHPDIAIEFKITSTMFTRNQVLDLRNSLVESLKTLIPDYKGGTVESILSQKLLPNGLVLVVQKSVYEAFVDGEKLSQNNVAGL